jgi:hypothetical protein
MSVRVDNAGTMTPGIELVYYRAAIRRINVGPGCERKLMSSAYMAKSFHEVCGSWTVELRARGGVQESLLNEVVPVILRLEQRDMDSLSQPWPSWVTEGLSLSRRVRGGIRRINRNDRTGSMVAAVVREERFNYGSARHWYVIECLGCARMGTDREMLVDDHGRALVWAVAHARDHDGHEHFTVTLQRRPKQDNQDPQSWESLGRYEIDVRHRPAIPSGLDQAASQPSGVVPSDGLM